MSKMTLKEAVENMHEYAMAPHITPDKRFEKTCLLAIQAMHHILINRMVDNHPDQEKLPGES